ncbi:MAG: hypothetical protein LBK77_01250, partial [Spirochaetaceae bacterium]|nr:hypothetical protein [Spirochaetaceae bacterium]
SGGKISGNTSSGSTSRGGGVYVDTGSSFSKAGNSVIYGSDEGTSLKNTAGSDNTNGHAVYYTKDSGYYRDATLGSGDNINTSTLPTVTGPGNAVGNWIQK